jgi:hypothetical protein
MTKRHFHIRAVWDDEAKVYFSESDIIGLHVEAGSLEDFEKIVNEEAAELIVSNHMSDADISRKSLRDLIPALIWQPPQNARTAQ